jgi:hypothetical protein
VKVSGGSRKEKERMGKTHPPRIKRRQGGRPRTLPGQREGKEGVKPTVFEKLENNSIIFTQKLFIYYLNGSTCISIRTTNNVGSAAKTEVIFTKPLHLNVIYMRRDLQCTYNVLYAQLTSE